MSLKLDFLDKNTPINQSRPKKRRVKRRYSGKCGGAWRTIKSPDYSKCASALADAVRRNQS